MADRLDELQNAIDAFIAERDWAQFHTPKNLAMGVAIEAAELMEHFLWATPDESAAPDASKKDAIGQQIGDVLIYLLRLARVLDLDIIAAARQTARQPREVPGRESEGDGKEVRRLEIGSAQRRRAVILPSGGCAIPRASARRR